MCINNVDDCIIDEITNKLNVALHNIQNIMLAHATLKKLDELADEINNANQLTDVIKEIINH